MLFWLDVLHLVPSDSIPSCHYCSQTEAKFVKFEAASYQVIADLTAKNEDLMWPLEVKADHTQPQKMKLKPWSAPWNRRSSDESSSRSIEVRLLDAGILTVMYVHAW